MRFDEQLTAMRKKRGLSQEQLAELVGVSRQAVSKWETGDALPDYAKLVALGDALGVSIDTLCGREVAIPQYGEKTIAKSAKKKHLICVAIAILLVAISFFVGFLCGRETDIPSDNIEELKIVGVKFTKLENSNSVQYQYVPSLTNGECTYQLSLCDEDGNEEIFDTECRNGRCAGRIALEEGKTYSVAVIAKTKENIYAVPIAQTLFLNKKTVIWE